MRERFCAMRFRRPGMVLAVLLVLAVIITAGCSSGISTDSDEKRASDGVYRIYYLNSEHTQLVRQEYKPDSKNFEGILKEILKQFCRDGKNGAVSAIPDGVKINKTTMGINEITVDFSSGYLGLETVDELLLRAAIVRTLLQLPGVDTIRITVDGQSLVIDGKEIGQMGEDTFIVPAGDAINSYRYVEIPLFFSNKDGTKVVSERRNIYYSSNIVIEQLVVEQIIKGPEEDGLVPVTLPSVLVRSVSIKDGVCTIDFSPDVNSLPAADSTVKPETALYSFVNAICDACADQGVTGVRFLIDGSSEKRFRGEVNLDQTFTRNADIIESSAAEVLTKGVVVDDDNAQDQNVSASQDSSETAQTE